MPCLKIILKIHQKNYQLGTFNQAIVKQKQIDESGAIVESTSLDDSSNSWQAKFKLHQYLARIFKWVHGNRRWIQPKYRGKLNLSFDNQNDR